jgi:hypothetical protein
MKTILTTNGLHRLFVTAQQESVVPGKLRTSNQTSAQTAFS